MDGAGKDRKGLGGVPTLVCLDRAVPCLPPRPLLCGRVACVCEASEGRVAPLALGGGRMQEREGCREASSGAGRELPACGHPWGSSAPALLGCFLFLGDSRNSANGKLRGLGVLIWPTASEFYLRIRHYNFCFPKGSTPTTLFSTESTHASDKARPCPAHLEMSLCLKKPRMTLGVCCFFQVLPGNRTWKWKGTGVDKASLIHWSPFSLPQPLRARGRRCSWETKDMNSMRLHIPALTQLGRCSQEPREGGKDPLQCPPLVSQAQVQSWDA